MKEKINVELTVKGDIERLHLGPGDVLMITLHNVRSRPAFEEIRQAIDVAMEAKGFGGKYVVMAGEQVELKVAGAPT